MDTIIELQRQTHEEIERFERALATVLSKPKTTLQARLAIEHKASQILDRITSRGAALDNLYENKEARDAEVTALSTAKSSSSGNQDDLAEFYQRLGKIKEYHQKYPDSVVLGGLELELAVLIDDPAIEDGDEYEEEDPVSLLFSGEETYGRYLDLFVNHATYNNLRKLPKRVSYLQYLDILLGAENAMVHKDLPQEVRMSKDFEAYLTALYAYLLSYTRRTQPLEDVDKRQREVKTEFNTLWDENQIEGWDFAKQRPKDETEGIWCSTCQKMYAKQTVYDAHLKSKKHIRATERLSGQTAADFSANQNGNNVASKVNGYDGRSKYHHAARLTYLITKLLNTLTPTLHDTKANVERRFSLTARERELELEEAKKPKVPPPPPKEGSQEEEEEEEKIYNPLKLPLGWDGKPIPYWLYKLHGLGVEYRCEICSDHVYMGRKNFERHFQEARHAFGMRALGLPNTKHFHEITKIEDALALAEKLKQEGRQEIFQQETMEELEDDEGNVYNKKTYDDLKKQGLI